jgi:hypothetical protein
MGFYLKVNGSMIWCYLNVILKEGKLKMCKIKRVAWGVLLLTLCLPLSACGKKGPPTAVGGNQEELYPGQYPPEEE